MALLIGLLLIDAHGCGGFGGSPARRVDLLACSCGTCANCVPSEEWDRVRPRFRCLEQTEIVERWGDVARVRVRYAFHTIVRDKDLFAVMRIRLGPLFAPRTAVMRLGDLRLCTDAAEPQPRGKKLGLSLMRRAPDTVDLRIYPIRWSQRTTACVEGFCLLEDPVAWGTRLYRTGDLVLAVVPYLRSRPRGADFVDRAGSRAFYFMSAKRAKARYPGWTPRDVPFVATLKRAVREKRGTLGPKAGQVMVTVPGWGPPRDPPDPPPPPPEADPPPGPLRPDPPPKGK